MTAQELTGTINMLVKGLPDPPRAWRRKKGRRDNSAIAAISNATLYATELGLITERESDAIFYKCSLLWALLGRQGHDLVYRR
jgi:hypothetical protein